MTAMKELGLMILLSSFALGDSDEKNSSNEPHSTSNEKTGVHKKPWIAEIYAVYLKVAPEELLLEPSPAEMLVEARLRVFHFEQKSLLKTYFANEETLSSSEAPIGPFLRGKVRHVAISRPGDFIINKASFPAVYIISIEDDNTERFRYAEGCLIGPSLILLYGDFKPAQNADMVKSIKKQIDRK